MSSVSQPTIEDLLQRAAAAPAPCDDATRESVRRAWAEQPDLVCGLVQRALSAEGELAAARLQIERLKRMNPAPASRSAPTQEELQRQSEAWGRLLGTSSRPRTAGTGAPVAARPRRARTFEDVGARFFADHAGKVWVFLLLLTAVVVLVQEKIV